MESFSVVLLPTFFQAENRKKNLNKKNKLRINEFKLTEKDYAIMKLSDELFKCFFVFFFI